MVLNEKEALSTPLKPKLNLARPATAPEQHAPYLKSTLLHLLEKQEVSRFFP